MKRLLNILLLLSLALGASTTKIQAQEQTQEQTEDHDQVQELMPTVKNVTYIYRNDDHFHGFTDSEVDSITFSRIDANGVEHTDYVTQIVYTPDSIYRIPLAAIDSVLCEQPKIELQDDVVMLSEEQKAFLLRADSTSILFRRDIPRRLLPEKGEVVVAMCTVNGQYIQFTGRVLSTQYTAEGALVTCNPEVEMGDIFRRLTAVMVSAPTDDSNKEKPKWDAPHSGNRENIDPFNKNFVWEPKLLEFVKENGETETYYPDYVTGVHYETESKDINLLKLLPKDKRPGWLDTDKHFVGLKDLKFEFNYRQKLVVDCYYDKDDKVFPSLYLYFRPTMLPIVRGKVNLKIEGSVGHTFEILKKQPAIPIFTPPIPPAIPPVKIGEVEIRLTDVYAEVGGETDIGYKFKIQKIVDFEVEHNNSGSHFTDMTKHGGYKDQSGLYPEGFEFGDSDIGDDIDHLGSAYLWLAWNLNVNFNLLDKRVFNTKFDFKIGPWFQLNIEKTKEEPEYEPARFYTKWSPSHMFIKGRGDLDLKVQLAKHDLFSAKDFLIYLGIVKQDYSDGFDVTDPRYYGIFPGFGFPKLSSGWEKSLNNRGVLSFTTPFKNPNHGDPKYDKFPRTLLSADLGLGIYKVNSDGTQTEVATSFSPKKEKGWFNSDEGTYSTEFKNVPRGIYRVAPLFDPPFFDPIRATPESDVIVPPSAFTEEVTGIAKHHCDMHGYALGLKAFAEATEGEYQIGWIIKKEVNSDGSTNGTLTCDDDDLVNKTVFVAAKPKEGKKAGDDSEDKVYFNEQCQYLTPLTTYIYRTWASYTIGESKKIIYGDIKEFTTMPPEEEPRCSKDLGLSVDWACYNVGASREQDFGNYYAWGEIDTKKNYTAATYTLPAKERISNDPNYDVATKWNVGKNSGWRMPTKAEIEELIEHCNIEWTTFKKVQGMKFTSKINGNSIFLPAAGNKYANKVYSNGIGGCYWSGDIEPEVIENALSEQIDLEEGEEEEEGEEGIGEGDAKELTKEEKTNAWRLHFNNVDEEGKLPHNEAGRCFYGRTIRPVKDKIRCSRDLGLSVDWACYNFGAVAEEEFGNYYAWGEIETKKEYTAATYKLPNKQHIAGDSRYDVATAWNVGDNSGWRMPTKAEIEELIANCTMEWTTINNVHGMKFTSKINGVSIFLPAAGKKYDDKVYNNGIGCCYWSGDIAPEQDVTETVEVGIEGGNSKEEKSNAWRLFFNNTDIEGIAKSEAGRCFFGRAIRPVKEK